MTERWSAVGRRLTERAGAAVAHGSRLARALARRGRRFARRYRVVTVRDGPARGTRIGLHMASNAYRDGTIELPVQNEVAALMPAGGVFYDIGANVGFFTLVAASTVDGDGTFVAFEPHPDVADALERNLDRNDIAAQVCRVAVSDGAGEIDLLLAAHPGGATIDPAKSYDQSGAVRVGQVRLDDLVERGEIPEPDLIKLDVEGAEPAALRGMEQLLRRCHPPIVFEIDAPDETRAEQQFDEVVDYLAAIDYRCRRLDPSYADSAWAVIHAVATATPTIR